MKQERTKDWVRLLPWTVLTIDFQESSSTAYISHELFYGRHTAWVFGTSFPEDYKSRVGDWPEHRQDLAKLGRANLKHVQERELTRCTCTRRPASFKLRDLVLVHHSRLPSRPRNCLQVSFFGAYSMIKIKRSRIHVRCTSCLGGELVFAPKQLRHYHSPDELSWEEWRLCDRKVECINLENAANLEEANKLEEMTADEMAVEGYYVVGGIASHEYKQSRGFLTL